MGDADDFIYDNPTAGQAVGGGEEEEPKEMSDAVRAVYEMLISSDRSVIDTLMVMVELVARSEPLAAAPPAPPPPLPPSPPAPPPPTPSFLLTFMLDPSFRPRLCGTDSPMPLQALVRLVPLSKDCRVALQTIAEDRWVEALGSIRGFGEDPVGRHACVPLDLRSARLRPSTTSHAARGFCLSSYRIVSFTWPMTLSAAGASTTWWRTLLGRSRRRTCECRPRRRLTGSSMRRKERQTG